MAAVEFERWFDKRLARKRRAMRRLERLARRGFWRSVLVALALAFFVLFFTAGFVSELVGFYWGPFPR